MIEIPLLAVAFLGAFAMIGVFSCLGAFSPVRARRRLIMDMRVVNNKRYLLMAAFTSQAHRHGDPEF